MPDHVASLFTGIGGFEAGFQKAGLHTAIMCESDPGAQSVLRDRFPDVRLEHDVTTMASLPPCAVLTAGWPCQDLSQAGRTAGMSGRQSSLVSHVFRLLDATPQKPNAIVLENVAFALSLERGKAVRYVTDQLAIRGYRWAYRILNTREFGLPHRRRRIFVCGMRDGDPTAVLFDGIDQKPVEAGEPTDVGFYWTEGNRGVGWTPDAVPPLKGGSGLSIPSPPAIWTVKNGKFQTPGIQDAERLQGFSSDWTAAARTSEKGDRGRWRLVGNAVSVPIAVWLGQRLGRAKLSVPSFEQNGTKSFMAHNAAWGGPKETTHYICDAGEGPSTAERLSVASFGLQDASPLSFRAARGFLGRYLKSGLTKNHQFALALAEYCGLRESTAPPGIRIKAAT